MLPDEVMKQIVQRILRYQFKPRNKPILIPLAESSVKREWLPEIRNVGFTFVPDEQVPDHEKGVFLFEGPERDGDAYAIKVGWGDLDCFADGTWWKFRIVSGTVRLWPIGTWGRGCGSSGSEPMPVRGLELGRVSPNELTGYEFFSKGKLKEIRMGISTREDLIRIFSSDCSDGCDYDPNWTLWTEYLSDGLAWTTEIGDEKTEFFAKEPLVGRLGSVTLRPKKPFTFRRAAFPTRRFAHGKSMAIGDAWGINGFEGAVHTSYDIYADGYGLTYLLFDEETFNNLKNKPKNERKREKGELIEIEYSIPESLNNTVYRTRRVPK
ncbi:MAG: hypothetical protein IPM25_03850 [Chloracidobacterium sp.]|nr:hypothetical protein [Chloracidobacterium sp.]